MPIDVVAERKGETCEQYEDKVQNIFKEKIGLENIDVERLLRSKGKNNTNKPRIIVCKLLPYKQKKRVL